VAGSRRGITSLRAAANFIPACIVPPISPCFPLLKPFNDASHRSYGINASQYFYLEAPSVLIARLQVPLPEIMWHCCNNGTQQGDFAGE